MLQRGHSLTRAEIAWGLSASGSTARFNGATRLRERKSKLDCAPASWRTASTGPLAYASGNGNVDSVALFLSVASTGPLAYASGNRRAEGNVRAALAASTGPLAYASGNSHGDWS